MGLCISPADCSGNGPCGRKALSIFCISVMRPPGRLGRGRAVATLCGCSRSARKLTDANAALFDPGHQFAGCIPGIHEVLRRQGLLAGRWCLNPKEELSPGQMNEIDRVLALYPHLSDDEFVKEHLDRWLS